MEKHGISFPEAQKIWDDPNRLEFLARKEEEDRFALIGKIEDTIWTAIITYRGDTVRIISVRRARKNEKEAYLHGRTRTPI